MAETFSSPVLVSSDSSLCPVTFGIPTPNCNCNENQDSDPFTGPDGALYVAYNNYNNAVNRNDNRNQVLLVKSTDGGASFSAPVKVADFYDLPDCATYQNGADLFRGCVPEQGSAQNSILPGKQLSVRRGQSDRRATRWRSRSAPTSTRTPRSRSAYRPV